jgi:hypothetical protein
MKTQRTAVSSTIFGVVTIVLIIVAAAGFYLYSTASGTTVTSTSTEVSTQTQVSTSTQVSTAFLPASLASGGFLDGGNLTKLGYTSDYQCTPTEPGTPANATSYTTCFVGAGNSTAVSGARPVFVLVPAYAGLSIFGVPALGASSQGYPVFNGQVLFTQCGAGGTAAACPDHPTYLYSPDFTAVEQHLGLMSGYGGLPEGVLPTPAHTHLVGFTTSTSIPWYVVVVLVFDPNVMPNAATGQCTATVQSNLTSATGNCLTSFSALTAAMNTRTTATANANATQNDPIYDTFGGVSTQVLIPGVTIISENSPSNTNFFLFFSVAPSNPYS